MQTQNLRVDGHKARQMQGNTPKPPTYPSPTRQTTGLGYLVFPPPDYPPFSYPNLNERKSREKQKARGLEEGADEQKTAEAERNAEEEARQEQLRQARRAREAEEARKGEEDWVRSGGVLRDAEGRRDWARTQAIREELKLREIERLALERWEQYETRWNEVLAKLKREDTMLRFEDIPWPVKRAEMTGGVEPLDLGLNARRVEEFLLESLAVRGTTVTKKDRVRSALLRWHPDKLRTLISRVLPEDVDRVQHGIGVVMECLQKLNAQS